MALRHSDRHLDPHGHSYGPRRDELHDGRVATERQNVVSVQGYSVPKGKSFIDLCFAPSKMSILEGESATELSSATASEITSPTAIAVSSPSASLLNSSRHDDFFRWALNFLSRDASYMKKKKS